MDQSSELETHTKSGPSSGTSMADPIRVVILGSGYAGIHAYRQLVKTLNPRRSVEIVLLSNTDYLLYLTMVYEVAAGNLPPSSMRQSVRILLDDPRARYMQGTVQGVDLDNQTVTYQVPDALPDDGSGLNTQSLSYDYLVTALGSETNFFGCHGACDHSLTLKDLSDAVKIKNRMINAFEQAELETDPERRQSILSFVIVGGGPTGATLAAKLADLLNNELSEVFPQLSREAKITVVEASPALLGRAGEWFSKQAAAALSKKGVEVLLEEMVEEVRPDGVACSERFLPAETVVWAAGVKARHLEIAARDSVERDERSGRIKVINTLNLSSYKNVFVTGDQSFVVDKDHEKGYPMRAQFAVRQGKVAGENIARMISGESLREFHWKEKGLVISLGEGYTLARIGGYEFSGPLATLIYKFVYLENTIGVRAKLRASMEWFLNLFLPRDITEL